MLRAVSVAASSDVEQTHGARSVALGMARGLSAAAAAGTAGPSAHDVLDAADDAFVDAVAASLDAGCPLAEAWSEATDQAAAGAEATRALVSRRGRSAVHGEHSIGTPDPGCVSFVIAARAAGGILERAPLEPPGGSR